MCHLSLSFFQASVLAKKGLKEMEAVINHTESLGHKIQVWHSSKYRHDFLVYGKMISII